ncbi:MAG: hypothetical protein ACR2O4_05080 [Hyphomicrobiaceae bacterium]
MRTFVNVLMVISALVAAVMIGNLIYGLATDGFSDGRGMAILVLMLWGAIAAAVTFLLGGLSWALGRKSEPASTGLGRAGMGFGFLGLAVLGVMQFF